MREWEGNVERQKERESGSKDRVIPHFPAGLTCSAPLFLPLFPPYSSRLSPTPSA